MLYKYIQIYLDSIHTHICIYVTCGVAKGRTGRRVNVKETVTTEVKSV